jgi:excisionase family DNA binding protein
MNPLLSVEQVAELLGVSAAWVYQHSRGDRRPRVPSVRLGRVVRFKRDSILRFIEEMERAAS